MTIRHHLPDDLLLAYAAGNLSEGWSLAIAAHLGLCLLCRRREAQFAAIGGAALEEFAPETVEDGALAACLARLDEPETTAIVTTVPNGGPVILPQPLRDYVGSDADSVRWTPVGGGIRQRIIETRGDAVARLLFIPPGESVPEHGHRGMELTLVLSGSFADGRQEFYRGDIEVADDSVSHTPIAGPGDPCICLAVTDAPLAFRKLLPRLAQRFLRI